MESGKYDHLKLESQLCFPLYVCSKEIIRRYKPYLDELDLTYTQYITMMVLWDKKEINVKELGACLKKIGGKRLYCPRKVCGGRTEPAYHDHGRGGKTEGKSRQCAGKDEPLRGSYAGRGGAAVSAFV